MKKVLVICALSLIGILSLGVGISYAQLQGNYRDSEQELMTILERQHDLSASSFLEVHASFSLQHRQIIHVRLRASLPSHTNSSNQRMKSNIMDLSEQVLKRQGSTMTSFEMLI